MNVACAMSLPLAVLPGWIQALWIVPTVAGSALAGAALIYGLLNLALPKVAAIARTAAHDIFSQPLIWVEMALGMLLIALFTVMPYNTFGDDVRMMKETSLTMVMILAIVLAVWSASSAISEELEGRTALTLLSKPVRRWEFVLGKWFGVLAPTLVLFVALGSLLLVAVSYKVIYESTTPLAPSVAALQCSGEMWHLVAPLFLAFLETVVLASISVALSTRFPMAANLTICGTMYVLGHLVPTLVQSDLGRNKIVTFVGQLLATVLPVLRHFDVKDALATGRGVPLEYVGWTSCYALLYCAIALVLALIFFEDRDLA